MNQYETAYPNEVHQLLITASRHLYVTRDGRVRFQKKVIEGTWKKTKNESRQQVIHYIVRDHYSRAMYAELHTRSEQVAPDEFLWRAWSQKDDYPFCGMPDFLILPKSVYSEALYNFIRELGIKIIKPKGGFMAGVWAFREWDRTLEFVYSFPYETLNSFKELQSKVPEIIRTHFDLSSDGTNKLDVWQSNVRNLRMPPSREEFYKTYQRAAAHNKQNTDAPFIGR
jgi:hypothetical protein